MKDSKRFEIPSNFCGCLELEKSAGEWRKWSRRIAAAGKIFAVAMVLWGAVSSVIPLCAGERDAFGLVSHLGKWAFYAVIACFLFSVLSLLFRSLAVFLENIGVMARLMAFQSAVDGYPDSHLEENRQWKCGCCGVVNTQKN